MESVKGRRVLIVGAGFYGSISAYLYSKLGADVTVVEKREHIGGNCYTEEKDGIHIHKYGPHIFHTSDSNIWEWMNRFVEFNSFSLRPFTLSNDKLYSLPFNMLTFNQLWGVTTPQEAYEMIENQRYTGKVTNLEEQALSLVGKDIYELMIRDYTKKQWGRDPKELPPSIIKRLPVRFTWDNNYFNDRYQGIPIGGYTQIFQHLLKDIKVKLNYEFTLSECKNYDEVVYTGPLDSLFNFKFGRLNYRSLNWDTKRYSNIENYQGMPMLNKNDLKFKETRSIEHRHFDDSTAKKNVTYITNEYPAEYVFGQNEPLYPINDDENNEIYRKYKSETRKFEGFVLGGRLARFKYYDMHQVIASALHDFAKRNLSNNLEKVLKL